MGLELLTQADLVLNACGRPVPPKGYKFVDLPKILPFHQVFSLPGFNFPPAPDTGNGDWTVTSLSSQVLNVIVSNNGGNPLSVTVVGYNISINLPNQTTTVATLVAFLNANAAFAAIAVAAVVGNGALNAQNPTSIVPFAAPPAPGQERIENISDTLFICMGLSMITDPVSVRIRWPNGTYWNQFPSGNSIAANSTGFPQGVAGNMIAFDEPVIIPVGGKVSIECSGPNAGTVDIALWGKLRYLLKEDGQGSGQVDDQTCIVGYPAQAQDSSAPRCLVGYPVPSISAGGLVTIPDPVAVLKERPRVVCWPNGNIMAPEFLLGNQCFQDTPPGYEDESFTLLYPAPPAPLITLNAGNSFQSYNNAVGVPGIDDTIIRRWRAITQWSGGATTNPTVALRSPSGYSVTGGDQIPFWLQWWMPLFPTLNLKHGTLIILDVSAPINTTGVITVQFEFDCVKRRRIQ